MFRFFKAERWRPRRGASRSTFWRTAARLSDIALSSCGSVEEMDGTTVSGTVCATAACGPNQPSCGYLLATISLAVSPYDCQAKVAATPTQNAIRNLIGTSPPSVGLTQQATIV